MKNEIQATFTIDESDTSLKIGVSIGPAAELIDLSGYAIAAILDNFPNAFLDAFRKAHSANQMIGKLMSHESFQPPTLDDESPIDLEELLAKLTARGGQG